MTRWTAVAAIVAALLFAATPASASDTQLRDGIKAAEKAIKPDADAWAQSVKTFAQNEDPATVRPPTQKLITDATNARRLLRHVTASSATGKKAKLLYLGALKKLRSGLRAFDNALAGLQSGQTGDIKAQLKKFVRRVAAAEKESQRAMKMLGIESS